jgi:PAS domain S-box-containing protein
MQLLLKIREYFIFHMKKVAKGIKLRNKAEEILSKDFESGSPLSGDFFETFNELQSYQIELEMQNEELKRMGEELKEMQLKYFDLYQFAPVGYFLLNENELIKDVNLAGASLLDFNKSELINMAFILFIKSESKRTFYKHLEKVKIKDSIQTCELELQKKDGQTVYAQLETLPNQVEEDRKGFKIAITNITRLKKAENDIKKSLKEKELLLKEIHHRVKNNLQIISSLLDLQISHVKEDPTAVNVLKESQNRVISMALIHEMIYQSKDLAHINIYDYINMMVSNLFDSYGRKDITPIIRVEQTYLNIETAVPLGLIISELVSNSLKHAFPETGEKREISVEFYNKKGMYELIIGDNGIGISEEIHISNKESTLGIRLVNSLTKQLDGQIKLDRSQGTKYTILFKEQKYKSRL